MTAAITSTPSGQTMVGEDVVIAGTGWSTDPVTITVENPESNLGLQVVVTPSTGAITTSGVVKMTPQAPGIWKFLATDGTHSAEVDLEVFES